VFNIFIKQTILEAAMRAYTDNKWREILSTVGIIGILLLAVGWDSMCLEDEGEWEEDEDTDLSEDEELEEEDFDFDADEDEDIEDVEYDDDNDEWEEL